MTQRLTLVADARVVARRGVALPDGFTMRATTEADAEALAQLYLSVYHPDVGARSLLEAREEMRLTFAGEFGPLWLEASPVIVDAGGVIRASVMTVTDAPLDWNAPAGPFVIEVLTSALWRGQGLARVLLAEAARAAVAADRATLAMRVDHDNVGALRLYGSLGFTGPTARDADALARARNADVGDWRSRLRRAEVKAQRKGFLSSTDAMSGALSVFAVLALVGFVAAIVGLLWLVAATFLSVFADSSTAVSPSPSPSVSTSVSASP